MLEVSTGINHRPVASGSAVAALSEPVAIDLVAFDANGDPMLFSIASFPEHGVLSGFDPFNGSVVYAPATAFEGEDRFAFEVFDGVVSSTVAEVVIEVTGDVIFEDGFETGSASKWSDVAGR